MINLRRGGVSLPWVEVHSAICEKLFGVVVLPEIYAVDLRIGWGQSAMGLYVYSTICETYLV